MTAEKNDDIKGAVDAVDHGQGDAGAGVEGFKDGDTDEDYHIN